MDDNLKNQVLGMLKSGAGKISATKFIIDSTGMSLREAKEFVDSISEELTSINGSTGNNELSQLELAKIKYDTQKKGCLVTTITLIVVFIILCIIVVTCVGGGKDNASYIDLVDKYTAEVKEKGVKMRIRLIKDSFSRNKSLINECSDIEQFAHFITVDAKCQFNMEYKYIMLDIYNEAKKKFPDSYIDQDAYCEENNCPLVEHSGGMSLFIDDVESNLYNDAISFVKEIWNK